MRVYQLNGSWYYVVDIGRHPVSGRRQQKKKGGFTSQKQAEKAAIKLLADVENGMIGTMDRLTFGELCDIWFNTYPEKRRIKQSTMRLRRLQIQTWKQHLDKIDVQKINRQHIQNSLNVLSDEYCEQSLVLLFAVLKMIFEKAIELGVIRENPCRFAYVPKKRKTLQEIEQEPITNKYLEREPLQNFLKLASKFGLDHDYSLFLLLSYTGLRIGEALALKWSDINLDEQSISITKTLHHENSVILNYRLDTPKTKTSVRTIAIHDKLIEELKRLRTKQKEFRFKHRNAADFDFVFVNYQRFHGYPITQQMVNRRLQRLVKIGKLPNPITPHMFRHTHTSLLAEAGVGLVEIMERLGHKDDKTTKDIYLHLTKQLKKEAAEKFARLMND